jgi:cytochrome c oxidase subunit 3
MAHTTDGYYVPHGSKWPIVGSIGLTTLVGGTAMYLNGNAAIGSILPWVGAAIVLFMMYGWFGSVIKESLQGLYNDQVDRSFRQGMVWFIFSEVMFFAAFFGALFYARQFSVPWLGGDGTGAPTNMFLWSEFSPVWPTAGPAELGGGFTTVGAFGLPLINTLLLLTSGITLTASHWGLKQGNKAKTVGFLLATIALGVIFLGVQAYEYIHLYEDLNLRMDSGIYGATFYMLTGFHGLHVTLGVIMLAVITVRCAKGHFSKKNHFGYEAVAWYWHFVDVVWLGLFVFVYVI